MISSSVWRNRRASRGLARLADQPAHEIRLMRGAAAPAEGGDVHRHRLAVELDRFLDRLGRERQPPCWKAKPSMNMLAPSELPNSAVAVRVASKKCALLVAGSLADRLLQPLDRQREIGRTGEIAGHDLGGVGDEDRVALAHRGQHLLGAGHDEVAAEHQVGLAGRHADGVDIVRAFARCGHG